MSASGLSNSSPSFPSLSVFSKWLARLRHLCLRTSRPDVTYRTTCGPSDQPFGSLQNKCSCPDGAPCRSRYVPRDGIRHGSATVTYSDDAQEEGTSCAGGIRGEASSNTPLTLTPAQTTCRWHSCPVTGIQLSALPRDKKSIFSIAWPWTAGSGFQETVVRDSEVRLASMVKRRWTEGALCAVCAAEAGTCMLSIPFAVIGGSLSPLEAQIHLCARERVLVKREARLNHKVKVWAQLCL